MRPKLEINLIPKTSFFLNVRSEVSAAEWDRLRRNYYKQANHNCEICGGKGENHPVECHEVWEYEQKTQTQRVRKAIVIYDGDISLEVSGTLRSEPSKLKNPLDFQ